MRADLKKYKLEKAASKDDTRAAFNCVHLDVANGVAVATTGHTLAVVPVELALDDASGSIPLDAIGIARRRQPKHGMAELAANGNVSVAVRDGRVQFDRGDVELPKWTKVLPPKSRRPVFTVSLNPKALQDLAEALGAGNAGVKLEVFGERSAIRVVPLNDNGAGAAGVVMPIAPEKPTRKTKAAA